MKRKILTSILILFLTIVLTFLYSYKKVSDHWYVSQFLTHSIIEHATFYKDFPITDNDLLGAQVIDAFWLRYDAKEVYWDSTRIKPYLKHIKLVNTENYVIVYYDNESEGIINLSDINFINYLFTNVNYKYFKLVRTDYHTPDQLLNFDLIIFKDFRYSKIYDEFRQDLKTFHSNIFNFQGFIEAKATVYLQIRNYKGYPIYHVIYKKKGISAHQINEAFRLLNQKVLVKYKGKYDIMNVPLVISDSI